MQPQVRRQIQIAQIPQEQRTAMNIALLSVLFPRDIYHRAVCDGAVKLTREGKGSWLYYGSTLVGTVWHDKNTGESVIIRPPRQEALW